MLVRRWLGLVSRGWEKNKFYKSVTVYETEDGYGVQLDHRRLRTPLRKLLIVPSKPLALAIAQEWSGQERLVQLPLMHMTALCNTVLDNPNSSSRAAMATDLLNYLPTDTLLYRQREPDDLVHMQKDEWDPVVAWFNERFSTNLQPTKDLTPPPIPPPSLSLLSTFLNQLNPWRFAGFHYAVESCRSLILTSALFEGHLDVESLCSLSQLETRHQTQRWGKVEWHHDITHEDLRSRIAASFLLAELACLDSTR